MSDSLTVMSITDLSWRIFSRAPNSLYRRYINFRFWGRSRADRSPACTPGLRYGFNN